MNMYNVFMKMSKPKKIFCPEEKEMLIDFVRKNKDTLENKSNDARIIKAKREKWEELSKIFVEKGHNRDWVRLRDFYHRVKCNAKVSILAYKKHIKHTGFAPVQVPSEYDWAIYEISPEDFAAYENNKDIDIEETNIVYIKQDTSEDMFYDEQTCDSKEEQTCDSKEEQICNGKEEQIYNNKEQEEINQTNPPKAREKRKPELNSELLRKMKIPKMSDLEVDTAACVLLQQKQKMELTLHKKRLEFCIEKHKKEMDCAQLAEQKLLVELETAKVNRLKLEKETQKLDLELEILKRKLDSN